MYISDSQTLYTFHQQYARPNLTKYQVYQFFCVDEKFIPQVMYFKYQVVYIFMSS